MGLTPSIFFSSLTTSTPDLSYSKYAIAASLGSYLVTLPFLRSRKSYWDALAAQKVLKIVRPLIVIEIICLCLLMSFSLQFGSPIAINNAWTNYGNGDSYLYGYSRPAVGILLFILGLFSDIYFVPRLICIFGCLNETVMDALSAFQVWNYILQVEQKSAPMAKYSTYTIRAYFYRDIVSMFLSFLILLYVAHLSCLIGWGYRSFIPYTSIVGGELDRCSVMRNERNSQRVSKAAAVAGRDEEMGGDGILESNKNCGRHSRTQRVLEKQWRTHLAQLEKNRPKQINAEAMQQLQETYGEVVRNLE